MYHQQQLQSHKQHLASSLPPEKQFLLQGGGDSGLILSTDAKPRLKWTPELHERFVEAVHQLGGSEKATPKTIMRLMGIPGLTLYHLKSHLQKYRLSKNLQAQARAAHAKSVSGCRTATDKVCEGSPASHFALEPQINRSLHLSEALQMQIEVQRRLHEQLEVQRHVQLRIEAQGKYLQSVLEKAQEALAKQGVDVDGLFKARHPPELRLRRQEQHPGFGDGSVDSCLTACEGFHQKKEHDDMLLSIGLCTPHQLGTSTSTSTSTSCCEEYVFLQEPTRVLASPSPADEQCGEFRRDDDGFIGSAAAELDLSINSAGTCRPRSGCDKIDLNGSNWK